jgi:hypothetical protein
MSEMITNQRFLDSRNIMLVGGGFVSLGGKSGRGLTCPGCLCIVYTRIAGHPRTLRGKNVDE